MIKKLKSLKEKNKILYYVALPLLGIALLVALVAKVLSDFNILGANKDLKNAELKDIDLAKEQEEAKRKAEEMHKEAMNHGKKAEEHENKAEEKNDDLDWHLKE